jgi:hypothetical protein
MRAAEKSIWRVLEFAGVEFIDHLAGPNGYYPDKEFVETVRLTNQLATLEMMKCDFWKAIKAHCNNGRSGTDGRIANHIVILPGSRPETSR